MKRNKDRIAAVGECGHLELYVGKCRGQKRVADPHVPFRRLRTLPTGRWSFLQSEGGTCRGQHPCLLRPVFPGCFCSWWYNWLELFSRGFHGFLLAIGALEDELFSTVKPAWADTTVFLPFVSLLQRAWSGHDSFPSSVLSWTVCNLISHREALSLL